MVVPLAVGVQYFHEKHWHAAQSEMDKGGEAMQSSTHKHLALTSILESPVPRDTFEIYQLGPKAFMVQQRWTHWDLPEKGRKTSIG